MSTPHATVVTRDAGRAARRRGRRLLGAALAGWLATVPLTGACAATAQAPDEPGSAGTAVFAGGCFWCVESDFDHVPGVLETVSGYTGGRTVNPTYQQVSHEDTGHREAVRIRFDPARVSYEALVEIFWRSVDPTDAGGQFCDRGESYETAIFVASEAERRIAESSRSRIDASGRLGKPIVTSIETAGTFYPAEDYHQDYHRKNPVRYKIYRYGCRRDARVSDLWGEEAHRGIERE